MSTETSPLLHKQQHHQADDTTTLHEARILVQYALPISATNLLRYIVQGSGVYVISQLGTKELAAINLGVLTSNLFGFAILIGLVSALDTLANQAGRSSSPKLTSIYAMRTFVVCCMATPFLVLLCFSGRPILHFFMPHADPEVLSLAADYLKVVSLALPPLAAYECVRRYLASLGLMMGPTICYGLVTPLAIFLNWLLVLGPEKYNIGFIGAAVATVVCFHALFVMLIIYAAYAAPRHTLAPLSMTIFHDLGLIWQYGLAGIASTCSEWFAFESISLVAGYLGTEAQASTAIFGTILSFCWQIPLSLSVAAAIRTGNLLGQNLPHKAKKSARVVQGFAIIVVFVNALFLIIFRKSFGGLFSKDPAVLALVNRDMYIIGIISIFDGLQGANTGVLKGLGLPTSAAKINLVSYWLVGLPIGWLVTLHTSEMNSVWGGLAISVALASLTMQYKIHKNDFEARAQEAALRITVSESEAHLRHDEETASYDSC